MKVHVDEVPEGGQHIEGSIQPSDVKLELPGYSLTQPLTFAARARKTGDDVYMEGNLRGVVNSQCSRCLTSFNLPLDMDVNVIYVPEKERLGKEGNVLEPDSNLSFYEGDAIDLLREVKDLIHVNLPIKPICRPDCRGLCPRCGADLNVAPCECEQQTEGSLFEKLRELKSRLERE
ncbi:MAG: DUF177 domain-containing protein [Candidatus Hydrogenedentota bacterium]|nr:MAG: DUF177 domain-containing protein [Candidatus Hydrogenedentota bacterium]